MAVTSEHRQAAGRASNAALEKRMATRAHVVCWSTMHVPVRVLIRSAIMLPGRWWGTSESGVQLIILPYLHVPTCT